MNGDPGELLVEFGRSHGHVDVYPIETGHGVIFRAVPRSERALAIELVQSPFGCQLIIGDLFDSEYLRTDDAIVEDLIRRTVCDGAEVVRRGFQHWIVFSPRPPDETTSVGRKSRRKRVLARWEPWASDCEGRRPELAVRIPRVRFVVQYA